jgi:hypothetical protein
MESSFGGAGGGPAAFYRALAFGDAGPFLYADRPILWSVAAMTLCPVALAAGCKKCPIFKVCPLKGVIGDFDKEAEAKRQSVASKRSAKKAK